MPRLSRYGWRAVEPARRPVAAIVLGLGGRLAWRRLSSLWHEAKQGGKILSDRRAYLTKVLVPQLVAWCCKVGVVAVLLAAYGIPVSFHTLFSVLGGNTLANIASLTPGGVGVNQAFNVASLHEATSAATASAYSVGHQLLSTVWNIALAAVPLAAAFGRSGRKRLVDESSTRAKELRTAPPARASRSKSAARTSGSAQPSTGRFSSPRSIPKGSNTCSRRQRSSGAVWVRRWRTVAGRKLAFNGARRKARRWLFAGASRSTRPAPRAASPRSR